MRLSTDINKKKNAANPNTEKTSFVPLECAYRRLYYAIMTPMSYKHILGIRGDR